MSTELSMLKLFCDSKELFDKYYSYTHVISNLEKEIKLLLNLVESYYGKYETISISREDLLAFYSYMYPNHKEHFIYTELIDSVFKISANPQVMLDLLSQTIERHFATKIVNDLISVVEGKQYGVLQKVRDRMDRYLELTNNPTKECKSVEPCTLSLEDLISHETTGGYTWPLQTLTNTIGTIKPGTLGLIFAYVDSGKSSFGVQTCMNALSQICQLGSEELIVYAGNEEAAARLMLRMLQCAYKKTRGEIIEDAAAINATLSEIGWNNLRLFDNVGSTAFVENLLKTYAPSILILDQGTKVSMGLGQLDGVREVQELFNWYREKAKEHNCSIISLAQAVGEAENKKWLKLSDVYGSRVSLQGELDYAIGIGRQVDDPARENYRYFHVSKNKLLNGEPCRFITNFVKERCYFEEI